MCGRYARHSNQQEIAEFIVSLLGEKQDVGKALQGVGDLMREIICHSGAMGKLRCSIRNVAP